MKQRVICVALAAAMILSGCSWMGGSYVSVTPHHEQLSDVQSDSLTASDYSELRNILTDLTEAGAESAVIYVPKYDQDAVEQGMGSAVRYITEILPIGAYAIDKVEYEIGTSAGQPAISVNITYLHGRAELRRIRQAADMEAAKSIVLESVANCSDSVVIHVERYSEADLVQLVADYATENPAVVMEIPQLAIGTYPDSGTKRVLELKFTYQTSRETLRSMQTQVKRVFDSAALYINQNDAQEQKFNQLFSFLSERFEYKYETSITPSYSLLCHGVGDARTFAVVYAAMCRRAELDCRVISGTKDGEAWYWNMIQVDDRFCHVDLLESRSAGALLQYTDDEMAGYVWDYSAYPAASGMQQPTEATE